MFKKSLLLIFLLLAACGTQPSQRDVTKGLHKISYTNEAEIQQLRDAGCEIIVREPGYLIVRVDSAVNTQAFAFKPFKELELVRRLVHVRVSSREEVQAIADMGADIWHIEGDTLVVASVFDIYIEKIAAMKLPVEVVENNISNMGEEK